MSLKNLLLSLETLACAAYVLFDTFLVKVLFIVRLRNSVKNIAESFLTEIYEF